MQSKGDEGHTLKHQPWVWFGMMRKPRKRSGPASSDGIARCEQVRDRITTLRLDRGLTQKEMSRRMGISRPFYSQLEKGIRRLDLLYLFAICRALDIEPAQLLEGI